MEKAQFEAKVLTSESRDEEDVDAPTYSSR